MQFNKVVYPDCKPGMEIWICAAQLSKFSFGKSSQGIAQDSTGQHGTALDSTRQQQTGLDCTGK